jgi:hypothetical protein
MCGVGDGVGAAEEVEDAGRALGGEACSMLFFKLRSFSRRLYKRYKHRRLYCLAKTAEGNRGNPTYIYASAQGPKKKTQEISNIPIIPTCLKGKCLLRLNWIFKFFGVLLKMFCGELELLM